MASTQEFVEFVCNQIDEEWEPRYRKMFGEYMVYVHEKPLLLICNNTVFVKKLSCLEHLMAQAETGHPYAGAKEHYLLDIEDRLLLEQVITELEKVITIPSKRNRKNSK